MLAVLIAVILVGSAVPIGAVVLSDPTGIIHGRAPTAVGDLYAVMPDGTTVVTNNVIVSQTATPSQFTVSSVTTGITPHDADGDTGLTMTPDMSSATLVWKDDLGAVLSGTQLTTALVSNYPGKTMTLEVHAPVTTTSTTGLPTTAGQVPFVTAYMVKVPLAPVPMPATVKVNINSYRFASSTGVPKTAFAGASFDIYMNGTSATGNGAYTWAVNRSHVTVSAVGKVTIKSKPTSSSEAEVTITATENATGKAFKHTFATAAWYVDHGVKTYFTGNVCPAGSTIPTARDLGPASQNPPVSITGLPSLGAHNVSVARGVGGILAEWGGTSTWPRTGYIYRSYNGKGGINLGVLGGNSSFWTSHRAVTTGWNTGGLVNGKVAFNADIRNTRMEVAWSMPDADIIATTYGSTDAVLVCKEVI
ncbi:hypothetical protein CRN84_17255 [Budvicia aquatica]|uniref:Invasin domain-containing protein n=1 Tax=Budvicia aquatica TaxID=82979 RepID=A0A2C6C3M7_9GAMM|nr:hypothetical protein CRN84_17255 [Budvicia aquatica]